MFTKKISVCSWCGNGFEIEDDELESDTCNECILITDDEVGLLDEDDLVYLKGDK